MKLQFLKDDELEQSFERAVHSERKIMHIVILHVQEISRRKLYLARGYGSLRDYLIKKMKYSGPAAQRRVEAAKLLNAVPALSDQLETGAINLSQVGEIHRAIGMSEKLHQQKVTPEQKAEIVDKVSGLNVMETQQLCAEQLEVPVIEQQRLRTQKDFSKRLEITLSRGQFAKYEQVRDLLAQKNFHAKRTQAVADVLETMFDEILMKKALAMKKETARHVEAEENAQRSLPPTTAAATRCETETDFSGPENVNETWATITPRRRKVILQNHPECEFKDPQTGTICGSTFNLHVDHVRPKWDGGSNDPSNLRVLCREHNLFRYKHQ